MNQLVSNKKEEQASSLILNNQRHISLTGIQEVYSANDKSLYLKTNNKKLLITGQNINITKLIVETGELEADGIFDSIRYSTKVSGNIFKRIFK